MGPSRLPPQLLEFAALRSYADTPCNTGNRHYLMTGQLAKGTLACVVNRHQISYKWKGSGTKKLNLDVVTKGRQLTKLYYAFEIKTNFEDGSKKYQAEETRLYPDYS